MRTLRQAAALRRPDETGRFRAQGVIALRALELLPDVSVLVFDHELRFTMASGKALAPEAEERIASFAELVGTAIANAETWERLARDATTDAVTGIANSRAFRERLELETGAAERHGRPLSVVAFDVDRFKQINDTFGHQTGDRVLAETARVLSQQARRHELVARLGGEEFGWILPDTDTAGAFAAAERARLAIEHHGFGDAGRVTVSAGVGSLDEGGGPESLMRSADGALYRAKAAGRNRTVAAPDDDAASPPPNE